MIHSGIYYEPGSLKARLCREGKAALEGFAREHGIPFEHRGKIVVAIEPSELGRLARLRERGLANGVEGLEEIGPEGIRELEPHVVGIRALHSPKTGVVDFREVALALGKEIRARGGEVLLGSRVTRIEPRGRWYVLATDTGDVIARNVIACAGLHSDRVAAMTGDVGDQRIVPFRGSYYRLSPDARHLVRGLVYPVPDPRFPFLGVHLTRRLDGEVWAGPNATLALAREGYRRRHLVVRDLWDAVRFPGLWRLAAGNARVAATEMWRDLLPGAYAAECRRYVPEIRREHLLPGPAGVRAQSLRADGSLIEDFVLQGGKRIIHVRNAPSPGATACLAIGRVLCEQAFDRFGLA